MLLCNTHASVCDINNTGMSACQKINSLHVTDKFTVWYIVRIRVLTVLLRSYESACTTSVVIVAFPRFAGDELIV